MRRLNAAITLLVGCLGTCFAQQSQPVPLPPAGPRQCLPATNLDEFIKALDAAVSGPANQDRSCFRSLMLPEARLIIVGKGKDGTIAPRILTVNDWIERVAQRGATPFYERQVKFSSERFANMAHLWSTYETRDTPDGKPDKRGINSIQAMFDGQQWKVVEILWQVESPADPIPQKYLP